MPTENLKSTARNQLKRIENPDFSVESLWDNANNEIYIYGYKLSSFQRGVALRGAASILGAIEIQNILLT